MVYEVSMLSTSWLVDKIVSNNGGQTVISNSLFIYVLNGDYCFKIQ